MTTGIARDLSAKLQGKIAELVEREVKLFAQVLGPVEIGEVMIECAVMLARTTAGTIAAYADEKDQIDYLFRSVTAAIVSSLAVGESDGIRKTVAAIQEGDR